MDASKRAAFELLIKRYTRSKRVTKESARQALIGEGIYRSDGEVSPEYGGKDRAKKSKEKPKA